MKKLTLVLLISIFSITAKPISLSDSLRVSLLTVSAGQELYSVFGHTAIRITDLKNGYDIAFNYGTFDFSTPNFYLKFALGGLDYMVSVETYQGFVEFYQEENRTVIEQELNFNKEQRLKLASLLIYNYLPENRFYRYKFFTDNCSTRIRDILAKASGDSLLLVRPAIDANVTFHKLYTSRLQTMLWARFGIGLVLGSLTNKQAGYDALFLPDNLMKAVDIATIENKPLTLAKKSIFIATPTPKEHIFFTPVVLAIIILVLSILIQFNHNWIGVYDKAFFAIMGLLGIFISTLSILSHHAELHYNFVILFLLPTNIILSFLSTTSNIRKYYIIIAFLLSLIGFIFLHFIPQTFNFAFLLIAFSVALRLFFNFAPALFNRFQK